MENTDWTQFTFYVPPGSSMFDCLKDLLYAEPFDLDRELFLFRRKDGCVAEIAPCPPHPEGAKLR